MIGCARSSERHESFNEDGRLNPILICIRSDCWRTWRTTAAVYEYGWSYVSNTLTWSRFSAPSFHSHYFPIAWRACEMPAYTSSLPRRAESRFDVLLLFALYWHCCHFSLWNESHTSDRVFFSAMTPSCWFSPAWGEKNMAAYIKGNR